MAKPYSPASLEFDRRSFVKSFAALGAGLAATAVLPRPARAQAGAAPGAGGVIASDAATVVATTAGRVRGWRRNGVYGFKGIPYGALNERRRPVHAAGEA